MTTGKSTAEIIEVVKAKGAEVVAVGAVVKRGKAALPYPVSALLELPLADYPPEECPLCRQGVALEDPGSRRRG
jgi:orotate phosphoribosyltransferase